jgi:SNF2 family DNA or RNA helicase
MLHFTRRGSRIIAQGDTFPVRQVLMMVPGAQWDPENRWWHYPYSAVAMQHLTTMFPDGNFAGELDELTARMRLLEAAMAAKRGEQLEPIPLVVLPPWDHQLRAYWFAKNRIEAQGGAMLALDMGCGKTKVTLDYINNNGLKRVLVTAPMGVLSVWAEQVQVHSCGPLPVHICPPNQGVEKRFRGALSFMEANGWREGIVVVNHESVWRDQFVELATQGEWDLLVVDESHRAKAPGGKLSRGLAKISNSIDRRLGLTGTPCPHTIMDLFAQARFIDGTVFPSNFQLYRSTYAVMGGYKEKQIVSFCNIEDWNRRFESLAYRVMAKDALDLPDAIHMTRTCELSRPERNAYNSMRRDMVAEYKNGLITAANALAKMIRLAQITQGLAVDSEGRESTIGTSKRDLLYDTLSDIQERAVVFYRFNHDLKSIREAGLSLKRKVFTVRGGQNELAEWKAAGDPAILAVQVRTGNEGVSMVEARFCIYYSKSWEPGAYLQSLARLLRPGQKRNVTYIHLEAENSIDQKISKTLQGNHDMVEMFLGYLGEA